jgi:hypothetical protein
MAVVVRDVRPLRYADYRRPRPPEARRRPAAMQGNPTDAERPLRASKTANRTWPTCQTAGRLRAYAERKLVCMAAQSPTRTLVNPRPEAVRLILSDGSERVVPPWGLAIVPRSNAVGQRIEIILALLLERRSIPGLG